MNLLIVDDDVDIRDSLEGLFRSEGFTVSTAANGAEALALLRRAPLPCAVILDLAMPVLGGAETYTRMRADPLLRNVPVFIFTSEDSAAPAGVTRLRKPADIDRLVRAVRRLCLPDATNGWRR